MAGSEREMGWWGELGLAWLVVLGLWVVHGMGLGGFGCVLLGKGGRRRWWLGWVVYTTISLFAREYDKDCCSLEKGIGQGSDQSDPEHLISRAAEQTMTKQVPLMEDALRP